MNTQELKSIFKQCDKNRLKFVFDAMKEHNKQADQQYSTRGWKGLMDWAKFVAPKDYAKHLDSSSSLESSIELLFYNVGLI